MKGWTNVTSAEIKDRAASTWFGYGRWNAPYWFVGKEPGGKDDPENYASWYRLGGHDLIGCREHDFDYRGPDAGKWHIGVDGKKPELQPTWRPLIALLLSYLGAQRYDDARIRDYQVNCWGSLNGETCLPELSGVAAPSTHSVEGMRLLYRDQRIATLKAKISDNTPKFVHFYGTGLDPIYGRSYADSWREIAGASLVENEPMKIDGTVFVYTKHATAFGISNDFWVSLGRKLRGLVPAETVT